MTITTTAAAASRSSSKDSVTYSNSTATTSSSSSSSNSSRRRRRRRRNDTLELTAFDEYLVSAVCLLSGILAVFVFYQISLSFVALRYIWTSQPVFSDLLGGAEYLAATLTAILMLPFNGIQVPIFYFASFMYVLTGFSFPIVVSFLSAAESFHQARILLVLLSLCTGIADSLVSIAGYGLAAILPKSRVPLRAAGCSLAGLIPWAAFQLLSSTPLFPKDTAGQVRLIWTFMPLGTLFAAPMALCVFVLNRRKWFREILEVAELQYRAQFAFAVSAGGAAASTGSEVPSVFTRFKLTLCSCFMNRRRDDSSSSTSIRKHGKQTPNSDVKQQESTATTQRKLAEGESLAFGSSLIIDSQHKRNDKTNNKTHLNRQVDDSSSSSSSGSSSSSSSSSSKDKKDEEDKSYKLSSDSVGVFSTVAIETDVETEDKEVRGGQTEDGAAMAAVDNVFLEVFRKSWLHLFSMTFSFVVFGMIFPLIAPYQFKQNYLWTTLLNGVSQIAHTSMRFITVYVPFVQIRPPCLLPLILIRACLFFPLLVVIGRVSFQPILHNPWFLSVCMVLFSGFHGWAIVLSCRYSVEALPDSQAKASAAKIITILTFAFLGAAQFSSKLLLL